MDRLKGKVALVTGGGRGIGRAIALALAREGANVAISSRTMAELERVADEVKACGGAGALAVQADATRGADQRAAVRRVIDHSGSSTCL